MIQITRKALRQQILNGDRRMAIAVLKSLNLSLGAHPNTLVGYVHHMIVDNKQMSGVKRIRVTVEAEGGKQLEEVWWWDNNNQWVEKLGMPEETVKSVRKPRKLA
jgi:hypothetical protein